MRGVETGTIWQKQQSLSLNYFEIDQLDLQSNNSSGIKNLGQKLEIPVGLLKKYITNTVPQ